MTSSKGKIIYELVRGVATYRCTCGGKNLRPYKITDDDDKVLRAHIYCWDCGAATDHDLEDLLPV